MFIVSPESGRIANSHPTPGNQPATGKSTRRSKDGKPNHGQAISFRYDAVSVKRDSISRFSQNAPLFGNLTKRTVALRVTFLPLTGALCDWENSHRKKTKCENIYLLTSFYAPMQWLFSYLERTNLPQDVQRMSLYLLVFQYLFFCEVFCWQLLCKATPGIFSECTHFCR